MAEKRLLPGDYQKKVKYEALDDTEKEIQKQEGFFTFPEGLKGSQEQGEQDFLVFYFNNKKQYEAVREFFEVKTSSARSHPILDSNKLHRLVRKTKRAHNNGT